jgi:hypothetical protein
VIGLSEGARMLDNERGDAMKLCEQLAIQCQQMIADFASARRRAASYQLEDLKTSLLLAIVATRCLTQYIESTMEVLAD